MITCVLAKDKAAHFGIRRVVQQIKQRMRWHAFLPAIPRVLIQMDRQPGDRFGQYPDAGMHRRRLHGGSLIDRFAGGCAAEKKRERAPETVLGLVAGIEKTAQHAHIALILSKTDKAAAFALVFCLDKGYN